MATKKPTRADHLKETAELRAALISIFNGDPDAFFTKAELVKGLIGINGINGIKCNKARLDWVLKSMDQSGVLVSRKVKGALEYVLASGIAAKARAVAAFKPPKAEVKTRKGSPAQFVIDVVRSTGRVRLTVQDLVIEIGVLP